LKTFSFKPIQPVVAISALVLMILPLSFCSAELKVVARVGEEIITSFDITDLLREGITEKAARERLIEECLIYLEAKRAGIKISEKEIEEEYQRIKRLFPDPVAFHQQMMKESLTPALLKKRIERQLIAKRYIQEKVSAGIKISPMELKEYLEEKRESLLWEESQIRLSQAVFSEKDKIPEEPDLLDKAMKDIGFIPFAKLSDEVQKAIAGLKIGEFSEPVLIQNSFAIFKITAIKKPSETDLAFLLPLRAKRRLYLEKFSAAYSDLIAQLKKKTEIKYYLD